MSSIKPAPPVLPASRVRRLRRLVVRFRLMPRRQRQRIISQMPLLWRSELQEIAFTLPMTMVMSLDTYVRGLRHIEETGCTGCTSHSCGLTHRLIRRIAMHSHDNERCTIGRYYFRIWRPLVACYTISRLTSKMPLFLYRVNRALRQNGVQ